MTLSEFLDAKVLPLASKFRGNAKGFFAELRNVPREHKKERDGLVSALENSFWRWENGTAAARHGRFKTLFETLDGQSSATSAAIVSQAKHDPEGALASAMGHVEKLAAKAEAALAAKQATAASYLQSVGREVVELATSPNPKISTPIQRGIEKSLFGLARAIAAHKADAVKAAASQPQMPDLTMLRGLERAQAANEFEKTGKLSEKAQRLIALRAGKL